MSCWALVPIKELAACKMRLAPMLLSATRQQLVRTLLKHVTRTLRDTPGIDHIALVSPERVEVAADIELLLRNRAGLNEDLTSALREAAERGADRVVIIPADLPLLVPADVTALLGSVTRAGAAVAPDRHERGTNALALALPPPLALAFGENSFARHLAALHSRGLVPEVLRRTGLSFDVDEMEDLHRLRDYRPSDRRTGELDLDSLLA